MRHYTKGSRLLNTMRLLLISSFAASLFCPILITVISEPDVPYDVGNRWDEIDKPVDPVYISGGNETYQTYQIDIGEEWTYSFPLEEGKRYHIFMVGDWVNNGTDPKTDYDITTYDPDGNWLSTHTESAGLPEQVSNDGVHQYFIPNKSGNYSFRIINDPRDSRNTEAAIFMVIEHIDTNVRYTRYLEGRDEETDAELLLTSWAYEIFTADPTIRVFVGVPDSLDMYEVRLYAMANPEEGVGYSISGISVPDGDLFNNFRGIYGGYNTSCKGDRNPDAMDSCEYSGEDMAFIYDTPSVDNNTNDIFYYVTLIAEHGRGEVEFYIQTDFDPPEIELIDPSEKGYAEEENQIKASVEDESEIHQVWVEYSDDGGYTWGEENLTLEGEMYMCELPFFDAGVYVNYTVYAEDDFGNTGVISSGFTVKNRVTLDCKVDRSLVKAGKEVKVTGTASSQDQLKLRLEFKNGEFGKTVIIEPDSRGNFVYYYSPRRIGLWSLQAFIDGDELNFPASSNLESFSVEKESTSIDCYINHREVKVDDSITVSGSVFPPTQGLTVEVVFNSPTSYNTEAVLTSPDGSFYYTFNPSEVGTWKILTQVKDDGVHAPSQSGLMEFNVRSPNLQEKMAGILLTMVAPPYLYVTIGLVGGGTGLSMFLFRDRLPFLKTRKKGRKSKKSTKTPGRYRRKS